MPSKSSLHDCVFIEDDATTTCSDDLEGILSDPDDDYLVEGIWMPLEEPLVLTTYRSQLDVQEALSDWFGASAPLFYQEASFSTRQVIETEMSILTPAEEKQHAAQLEEAMLKELRDWHNLGSWTLAERAGVRILNSVSITCRVENEAS